MLAYVQTSSSRKPLFINTNLEVPPISGRITQIAPEQHYWQGSRSAATVDIATVGAEVKGNGTDFTAARDAMRQKLKAKGFQDWKTWQTPDGFSWNHAGEPGSTVLELVDANIHNRVAHKGGAAFARALLKAKAKARGVGARGLIVVDVYQNFKDAIEFAENSPTSRMVVTHETYYFVDETGSVFFVRLGGLFGSNKKIYVDAPKAGQEVVINSEEVGQLREIGEEVWGRLQYDIFGRPFKFIPGTRRDQICVIDPWFGTKEGYFDEEGYHELSPFFSNPGIIAQVTSK